MPVYRPSINLSLQQKADMYYQLAAMEEAGLPADQAFSSLIPHTQSSSKLQNCLHKMAQAVKSGTAIASAGGKLGLFNSLDRSLIQALADSGQLASAYRRLAQWYEQKAADQRFLRSKLAYPLTLLLMALLIRPFTAWFIGTITLTDYILQVLQPLTVMGLMVYGALHIPFWLGETFDRIWLHCPVLGNIQIRRNVLYFMQTLALLLEAGIPMLDALPKAVNSMPNRVLQRAFGTLSSRIQARQSFADAVRNLPYLNPVYFYFYEFINTGEMSGRLPEMLQRYANQEQTALRNFDQQLAEWLPRLVYGAVALWIATGIIQAFAVRPLP